MTDEEYDKLRDSINGYQQVKPTVTSDNTHKHYVVSPSSYTTGGLTFPTTNNAYPPPTYHHTVTPPPYIPPSNVVVNLGTEEECPELLAMISALGMEPLEGLHGCPMVFEIGGHHYSIMELMTKQFQFMCRMNTLLCHRGLTDEN